MRIMKSLVGAAVLLALTAPTFAADMDEPVLVPAQEEYQPVEIGSGWYLRGDVGYGFNNKFDREFDRYKHSDSWNKDTTGLSGSVGMGYHFNDYFRGELNLGALPSVEYSRDDAIAVCDGFANMTGVDRNGNKIEWIEPRTADCDQRTVAKTNAYDLMANAYIDLGTYAGFTPYVGAGLGAMYVKSSRSNGDKKCITTELFNCFSDKSFYEGDVDSKTSINFAYSLGAGFGYKVTDNATIDLGYEYKAAPGAKYYNVVGDNAAVEAKGLDFHNVKLGLRYDLW